jgi:hypothetical protein
MLGPLGFVISWRVRRASTPTLAICQLGSGRLVGLSDSMWSAAERGMVQADHFENTLTMTDEVGVPAAFVV